MTDLIARIDGWLTPARRKRAHALVAASAATLVAVGALTPDVATSWAGLAVSALGISSMVLATIKARRVDMTAAYASVAAVIVAAQAAGILRDGVASHWLDTLAAVAAAIGPLVASWRTDPTTPTGEPAREYDADMSEYDADMSEYDAKHDGI